MYAQNRAPVVKGAFVVGSHTVRRCSHRSPQPRQIAEGVVRFEREPDCSSEVAVQEGSKHTYDWSLENTA